MLFPFLDLKGEQLHVSHFQVPLCLVIKATIIVKRGESEDYEQIIVILQKKRDDWCNLVLMLFIFTTFQTTSACNCCAPSVALMTRHLATGKGLLQKVKYGHIFDDTTNIFKTSHDLYGCPVAKRMETRLLRQKWNVFCKEHYFSTCALYQP